MSNYSEVTFRRLYDEALNTIKNACDNYARYSTIDGYLKNAGQQKTFSATGGAPANQKRYETLTIVEATRVVQVVESTINTDFYNYIVTTKGFNLDEQVTTNKLYYFINCVCAFIETKIRVAGTDNIVSPAKAVIYVTNYNTFPAVSFDTNPSNHPELIRASDVNSILSIFKDTITRLIKPYVVKYSFS